MGNHGTDTTLPVLKAEDVMLRNVPNQHDRDQRDIRQSQWCRPGAQKREEEEENCCYVVLIAFASLVLRTSCAEKGVRRRTTVLGFLALHSNHIPGRISAAATTGQSELMDSSMRQKIARPPLAFDVLHRPAIFSLASADAYNQIVAQCKSHVKARKSYIISLNAAYVGASFLLTPVRPSESGEAGLRALSVRTTFESGRSLGFCQHPSPQPRASPETFDLAACD